MTSNSKSERHLAMAFLPPVMDPEYALSVIDRALGYRDNASDSVRSRLNSAIVRNVNVPGFRDSSIAPRPQLRDPILTAILTGEDEKLAGEILRCWTESNASLRRVVSEHLTSKGATIQGPDLTRGVFRSVWLRHEWASEVDVIANGAADGRFNAEDIGLMLSYLSGRVPTIEATVEMASPLFQKWLDELNELPPEAPEWEHVDDFASSLTGLALQKLTERVTVQVQAITDSISEVRDGFEEELRYLELDLSSWSAEDVVRAGMVEPALEQVTDLKSALSEYRRIRPQASSRSEELVRAPEREKYEKSIFDMVEAWDEIAEVPEIPIDVETSEDQSGQAQANGSHTADGDSADATADGAPELDLLRQDNETLSTENNQLKRDGEHLRADLNALNDQIAQLRAELTQSREMQEHWRKGYVLASAGQARTEPEEPAQLSSVDDALELAEQSFPDRIRLALNSKSNSRTPFQKPDEVFDALAWLATEYHRLRINPGDAPNFDKLIKESCPGWSYKPKQTEVTKDQFTEWYTTTLGGKSYGLDAHIGKGTSFDPHQTIRIAFDWDDELKQVIVGFVGRHQKNRTS